MDDDRGEGVVRVRRLDVVVQLDVRQLLPADDVLLLLDRKRVPGGQIVHVLLDVHVAATGEIGVLVAYLRCVGRNRPVRVLGTVDETHQVTVVEELDEAMSDRFEALRAYLLALGDDVQETTLRFYIAFKRIKNFACVEFRSTTSKILVFVKVDPATIALEAGFTRDVSKIGHYGTGDLEITLAVPEDLERASRHLNLSHYLRGSVRHAAGQLKIMAQLLDARDGRYLWSEVFERAVGDLHAIEEEIAGAIAQRFRLTAVDLTIISDRSLGLLIRVLASHYEIRIHWLEHGLFDVGRL